MNNRQLFIRFKDIPENEISGVYDGDCGKIRDEIGVSCYECIRKGKNYNIIISSTSFGFVSDLAWFINDFEEGKIPAYLIEAEQIGLGTYGEPVVKNIHTLNQLEIVELANPKPKFKMDKTNPQLRCKEEIQYFSGYDYCNPE